MLGYSWSQVHGHKHSLFSPSRTLRAEGPKRAALTRSWCWSVALARVHLDGLSLSAPPSTLLPLLTKSKILQPEFQYACVLEELYHCQPWVNPMHCGLCCAEKICRLGVVYCDECYTCTMLNPQPICNLTRESSAIHDCSVADMPQIKKWMGGGG